MFKNLRTCLDSTFRFIATFSVEVLLASDAIDNIACLEYCFNGMQKSGKRACVELQFFQINLGTVIFNLIIIFSILKITVLLYVELKGSKWVLPQHGQGVDRNLHCGSKILDM